MPTSLGKVQLTFLYYETPAELLQLLRQLEASTDVDVLAADSRIVLAIPDKLRRFLGWSEKHVPRPVIYNDVLAFEKAGL